MSLYFNFLYHAFPWICDNYIACFLWFHLITSCMLSFAITCLMDDKELKLYMLRMQSMLVFLCITVSMPKKILSLLSFSCGKEVKSKWCKDLVYSIIWIISAS